MATTLGKDLTISFTIQRTPYMLYVSDELLDSTLKLMLHSMLTNWSLNKNVEKIYTLQTKIQT